MKYINNISYLDEGVTISPSNIYIYLDDKRADVNLRVLGDDVESFTSYGYIEDIVYKDGYLQFSFSRGKILSVTLCVYNLCTTQLNYEYIRMKDEYEILEEKKMDEILSRELKVMLGKRLEYIDIETVNITLVGDSFNLMLPNMFEAEIDISNI